MSPVIATRTLARLGMITSAALILFTLESLAPRPLPWMKLGLGNAAVLLALVTLGPFHAIAVSAVKILAGSLMTGSLGSPAFVIGGGASLSSVSCMALLHRTVPGVFSAVGLSVAGAVVHQLAQLVIAYLYIGHAGLFSFVPLFLVSGLISGALIGLVVFWCVRQLARLGWSE